MQTMNTDLAQRLLSMAKKDAKVRAELAETGELFDGYAPRLAEVHDRNAQELEAIIGEFGWPGSSLVGPEGAAAAWLILQHAIGQPALQRKCLPLLREAAAQGEVEPRHVAMLEDRICFFERRPQRYGTQFDWNEDGQMAPWVIDDPDGVDERRRSVGLEPLSLLLLICKGIEGEEPPQDHHKRQEEMMAWARSVGWL